VPLGVFTNTPYFFCIRNSWHHHSEIANCTKPVNGVLKKTLRRRIVKVLAMIEIVIYLLFGKVFRTKLIENDEVGKTA
jgi:hypothetical protein